MRAALPIRCSFVTLAALAAAVLLASAAGAATDPDTSLATNTAPPWNPPHVIGASEPWEAVVRFPGRVVSLPLAALGEGARRLLLAAEQGFYVERGLDAFKGLPSPVGVGPAGLGDRTGFGAGVTIRPSAGALRTQALFELSTLGYTRARMKLGLGLAMAEYRIDERPAERFFGLGMDAREDDESRYGLRQERVIAGLEGASSARAPNASFALWAGPRWTRTTQGYGGNEQSVAEGFPGFLGATLDREIEHLTYGARVAADHRAGRPHWSRGWRASAEAERFDRPLVASPARTGAQFTRYTYLAEAGTSFWRDPRTLRLTLTVTDNEPGAGGDRFLVSDLARLGGSAGLAGFEPHRFHDIDALNLRATYLFPISEHFEVDLHGDAGGVFADVQHDLHPNLLRQSAGFALRARSNAAVLASVGFDLSPEAARFVFAMGAER